MNREIKFRAKEISTRQWIYGFYHIFDEEHFIIDSKLNTSHINNIRQVVFKVDKETISQYTGLKDENGVEIYEGDILKVEDCHEEYFKVEYHPPQFCLADSSDGILCDLIWKEWEEGEVIGNIYENPEL